jgi:hypothetical protein
MPDSKGGGDVMDAQLVERVARAMYEARHTTVWDNETNSLRESYRIDARAAIAALSMPEFVLPLAEEMLREARQSAVNFYGGHVCLTEINFENGIKPVPCRHCNGSGKEYRWSDE